MLQRASGFIFTDATVSNPGMKPKPQIPAGGTIPGPGFRIARNSSERPHVLDSVVFADGEFAGPDIAQAYRFVVAHIDGTRGFAAQALADMTRIETAVRASHNASLRERVFRRGQTGEQMIATVAEDELAEELYGIQKKSGIEAARQAAYRLSQIPQLWKRS
jgi:hypothetical protein